MKFTSLSSNKLKITGLSSTGKPLSLLGLLDFFAIAFLLIIRKDNHKSDTKASLVKKSYQQWSINKKII
jgi:hypothetical protein